MFWLRNKKNNFQLRLSYQHVLKSRLEYSVNVDQSTIRLDNMRNEDHHTSNKTIIYQNIARWIYIEMSFLHQKNITPHPPTQQ